MADDVSRGPSPFDVQTIKSLVALMSRHDLSEIDLREGELRIRLRRGAHGPAPAPAPAAVVPADRPEADRPGKTLHLIKSPTTGTFYARPKPDAQPYVRVGTRVTPTTVVCQIEAMKIFNEIQAECSGVITEILVENQQPVEYDQPLFRVDVTA